MYMIYIGAYCMTFSALLLHYSSFEADHGRLCFYPKRLCSIPPLPCGFAVREIGCHCLLCGIFALSWELLLFSFQSLSISYCLVCELPPATNRRSSSLPVSDLILIYTNIFTSLGFIAA